MTLHTVIASCVPAIFAYVANAIRGAVEGMGFSADYLRRALGMAMVSAGILIQKEGWGEERVISTVASPGGLTAKGLEKAGSEGLGRIVSDVAAQMLKKGGDIENEINRRDNM